MNCDMPPTGLLSSHCALRQSESDMRSRQLKLDVLTHIRAGSQRLQRMQNFDGPHVGRNDVHSSESVNFDQVPVDYFHRVLLASCEVRCRVWHPALKSGAQEALIIAVGSPRQVRWFYVAVATVFHRVGENTLLQALKFISQLVVQRRCEAPNPIQRPLRRIAIREVNGRPGREADSDWT